jgi:N-methylhydantoinase A/oxoprolinase/acetone carboxylase beta subunit
VLLGVDVGGTFTDAVLVDGDRVVTAKTATTPDDQSGGVLRAVREVLRSAGRDAADVVSFAHGMTVATNALLEGAGARTAFVATEGFTDIVELGRQDRADLYRLEARHPPALTPPDRRIGAAERHAADGTVLRVLDEDALTRVVEAIADCAAQAVAVCLLHADRHPAHEERIGEALARELPDVHVSLSHAVVGTIREYERAATTEVDAALSPLLGAYLRGLARGADAEGLPSPTIMQSSGGLTDIDTAADHAALTVLSGPAGGAAAAELLASATGVGDLLCLDMGGTSCDVSVVRGGRVAQAAGATVANRVIALPTVDIHTVGAGGGSVAWADAGGALRVGPRSAGAVPGPACYGRGGSEATVTDAHAVLGHLPPEGRLAGDVDLDLDAARVAVDALGARLGLDRETTARGILEVADAEMIRALRVVTVERGVDPRDLALLAFGGAGPLHACAIADELGMRRVLVPRAGGVLSALGLAAADRHTDEVRTVLLAGPSLTADALREIAGDADEVTWDVRYRGQSFELTVRPDEVAPAALRAAFEAEHEERYGYADPDGDIEVVTARRRWVTPGPVVVLEDDDAAVPAHVDGPAVVALPGATLVVPEGWSGTRDGTGTLHLERGV